MPEHERADYDIVHFAIWGSNAKGRVVRVWPKGSQITGPRSVERAYRLRKQRADRRRRIEARRQTHG